MKAPGKIRLALIFVALICNSVSYAADGGVAWGYTGKNGPEFWGKLAKTYHLCSVGKEQSPINIENTTPVQANNLQVHYQPAPINIINDGLTRLNIHGRKTIINDGHTLQINFPQQGPREFVAIKNEKYRLIQLHFHTPSETLINGKNFPLEIHFVNQTPTGKVAVIAVFVQPGKANPALTQILNNLPPKKKHLYTMRGAMIDLRSLVPENKSYYSFLGSLTTPPCSEGLQWFVMATPIEASAEQIVKLQEVLPANNARPVQKLNNRTIGFYSE